MVLSENGKLITSFPVVTGNTSKGNGTPPGIYPLNYKDRDTYLTGRNYRSHVNYWMPFNGNIGLSTMLHGEVLSVAEYIEVMVLMDV